MAGNAANSGSTARAIQFAAGTRSHRLCAGAIRTFRFVRIGKNSRSVSTSSSRVSCIESLERVSCVICHWLLCVPPVAISRIRFPVAPAQSHGLRGFKIVHNKDPKIITDIRNYIYVCVKCQMLSEYV